MYQALSVAMCSSLNYVIWDSTHKKKNQLISFAKQHVKYIFFLVKINI